jgi:hypothetical protein
MDKTKIKKNNLGDTRTADRCPTFTEFNRANEDHASEVARMMANIGAEIKEAGRHHDYTKIFEPNKSIFYRELCGKIEGKIDSFEDGEWYPMHCRTERHHLNNYCPDDVNLIDVLEMICDCVCAGMARSGSVYPINISSEILQKAVKNTVEMCIKSVEIEP